MKEMDLILGPFADGPLATLDPAMVERYEAMLSENDQDLYRWITARIGGRGEAVGPADLVPILDAIAVHVEEKRAF
ncbi:succinate dehydrogenase assembly factor 2 [Paracoccus sp. TK19116]|uniref:FAD assembly factor SdhE n=2 Tax=Paracoccus albicereus TaxID=2922394 RepID=A0ABT1MV75_9RHOB|nr:succinate dehydrogenase assembly factor 2 [Paracoccus albicereus]